MRRFLSVALLGLAKGLVIGIALAVAASRGLGLSSPNSLMAALLAGVAGSLVGLVAGRPIWDRDAKTEALLKATVGALIAAGSSFALRRWLLVPLDLSSYGLGSGAAGSLAAVSLPLVATVLALFFEVDNGAERQPSTRGAELASKQRVKLGAAPDELLDDLDLDAPSERPAERDREKR